MDRRTVTAGLVATIAGSISIGLSGCKDTPRADKLTPVTVAQVGDFFLYLPLYYAKDRGFFEKNGLDVSLINSGGDEKSVAAILSGSAQFGVGDPTFAAIATEKGQSVKVVASVVNGVPFWGVTKKAGLAEVTDPKQLRGLKVATFPKPSTAYVLQEEMFEDGGLQPNIVQAQFGSLLPLLDNNGADIVLELEPNVSTAESSGARVIYSMAKAYPEFAITGVTVTTEYADKNPETVKKFVDALEQAVIAAYGNQADLIAYAETKFPNLPKSVVDSAAKRMMAAGTFPRSTKTSPDGWRQALSLRVDSGDLKTLEGTDGILSWPLQTP
jgi:NitT/TauT family transport system substrate-binding protein